VTALATTGGVGGGDRGRAVVDTNVWTALLRPRSALATAYARHLDGRSLAVAYPTVVEARYGALRAGWGEARQAALQRLLHRAVVLPLDDETANVTARLRHECLLAGHALHQAQHTADLWIAATAIRWDLPLVSHDGVFVGCPGLDLVTELSTSA
jgi:hypothetical protein